MGMRDEIQQELAAAFDDPDGLADTVSQFTGKRESQGGYDPVTGTGGVVTITYGGRGIFGRYEAKEVDGTLILSTDEKLLVLQNELFGMDGVVVTAAPAVPAVGDTIQGKRVVHVARDPADATFTLQLRA